MEIDWENCNYFGNEWVNEKPQERKSRIFAKCKNVSVIAWFHEFNDKTKIWLNYNWLWLQSDKHSQNFSMLCFAVPSIRILLDFKKHALGTFWVTQIYP